MKSRERQLVVPVWGAYLQRLRGKKTPAVIVRRLREMQIPLTRGTLWQYEHGTVAAPDPVILKGLGDIYRTDIVELISVLAANRADRNLTANDVEGIVQAVRQTRATNAAAATRLVELQETVAKIAGQLLEESGAPRSSADEVPLGRRRAP